MDTHDSVSEDEPENFNLENLNIGEELEQGIRKRRNKAEAQRENTNTEKILNDKIHIVNPNKNKNKSLHTCTIWKNEQQNW